MRNGIKYFLLIIVVSIISTAAFQYYQNFTSARAYNNFLDSSGLISALHYEASDEFKNVLDFSETNPFGDAGVFA